MKKIDLEQHFYDTCILDVLEKRKVPPCYDTKTQVFEFTQFDKISAAAVMPLLLDIAESRLKQMDQLGIDMAVLSCSPGPEQFDIQESIDACSKVNDALGAIIKKYPGRFFGSATLPVKDPEAACKELERCVKQYGFVSWHTHSNYLDSFPDDSTYRPIFKKASDLGVYVYLHPTYPNTSRLAGFGPTFSGAGLGYTIDTMITLCRLIVSGIFDEMPNLKICTGHLGEALPFLLERIDNRLKFVITPLIVMKKSMKYYFKNNVFITTSGNMSMEAFQCAKNVLGIDNIMYGSDYPYEPFNDMIEFLASIPMTEEEREKLYYKNAINKLGITF